MTPHQQENKKCGCWYNHELAERYNDICVCPCHSNNHTSVQKASTCCQKCAVQGGIGSYRLSLCANASCECHIALATISNAEGGAATPNPSNTTSLEEEILEAKQYCIEQNGRDSCKNCGLDFDALILNIQSDLSKREEQARIEEASRCAEHEELLETVHKSEVENAQEATRRSTIKEIISTVEGMKEKHFVFECNGAHGGKGCYETWCEDTSTLGACTSDDAKEVRTHNAALTTIITKISELL